MDIYTAKLVQMARLAEEVGQDRAEWFVNMFRRLTDCWNEILYQKTLDMLRSYDRRPILNTTFPPPFKEEDLKAVDGQYKVGFITGTDIEFGFTPLQLNYHAVIGGQSGFGKSTFVKVLAREILREGNTLIWLIDPKEGSGDFRFLAKEFRDFIVLRPSIMKCNPFTPIPNVPINMLRETLSEVTADAFGVYDASEGIIAKHVERVFREHEHPNLFELIASLRQEKVRPGGRTQGYLDSVNTRLTKAKISLGEIINCREDYFSKLYDKSVVFEVGELSGSAQRVLVPWIIMKLVLYKIKNPTPYLSHLLVFDEAQSELWSRQLEMRGRTSYMATLATRCRSYGLGIMVLAQNPAGKLMTEIVANSCIKLCFHLGSGFEVDGMARNMGLNYEQKEEMYHLKSGEAICRIGLGYTEPMRLDIHNFQDQPVSDDELAQLMMNQWRNLLAGVEPVKVEKPCPLTTGEHAPAKAGAEAKVMAEGKPVAVRAEKPSGTTSAVARSDGRSSDASGAATDLSSDEWAYLRVVATHPWRLVTELYSLLSDERVMGAESIGQSKAVRLRKRLTEKRYLESFPVSGTGRSGRYQCDVVTEKAGLGKVPRPRGGYLHAFWCYRVAEFFRRSGAEARIGDTYSGNECDIGVKLDGKRIGVEIVVSSLVLDNLSKYISTGYFDEMIIVCINSDRQKEMEELIAGLSDDVREKVRIELTKEYFISL